MKKTSTSSWLTSARRHFKLALGNFNVGLVRRRQKRREIRQVCGQLGHLQTCPPPKTIQEDTPQANYTITYSN
jgi:hypothetical protein